MSCFVDCMGDLAPSGGGGLIVGYGVKEDGGKIQEERREGKLWLVGKIKRRKLPFSKNLKFKCISLFFSYTLYS